MTPSEIAAYFDTMRTGHHGAWATQAAATIRELEGLVAHYEKAFANAQNADAEANGLLRAKLKIATEALESVNVDASALCRSTVDAPEAVYEIGLTAAQALARIDAAE